MDQREQILAAKTRLTTIKGYAQLLERDIGRNCTCGEHTEQHVAKLNQEIDRLIGLVGELDASRINLDGTADDDPVALL